MRCPHCDAEVGESETTCPACGKPLAAEEMEWVDFVTVMTTRDHSELAVAKSVLEAAGIEFFARNEEVENLIAAGPVELQVRAEDEEEAKALLLDLEGEES
jgi:RNA polymerase subunit RPABC4/transcription elongation factor Spt4